MTVESYQAAKDMYFLYLGSRFYMSRSGEIGEIEARFDSFGVPEDVIQQWAIELKAQQMALLNQPGNWQAVSFLVHNSYLEHLSEVVAMPPLGRLLDKCIYLEVLLTYTDRCAGQTNGSPVPDYTPSRLWAALDHVIASAEQLLRVARSRQSIDRVNNIIEHARQRLAACQDPTGRRVCLWRWNPPTATATPYPISN